MLKIAKNRKYRVLIRAFTSRRDIAMSIILARTLERLGCIVVVSSIRDFTRNLRYWKPDAVVIETISQIERCKKESPNSLIIQLHGEGGNYKSASDANTLSKQPGLHKKVALYLLWGHKQKQFFNEYLPDLSNEKLHVCGNPRLDLVKYNPDLLNNNRETIGVITRYSTLNRHSREPALHSFRASEDRIHVQWQVDNLFATVELIRAIIDKTEYNISIRPHPLESPDGYSFMLKRKPFIGRVEIDDSFDVAYWTSRQKIVITPSSTSFLESFLLKVPMINIDRLTGNTELSKNTWLNASNSQNISHNQENIDEALELIKQNNLSTFSDDEVEKFLNEFHEWNSKKSSILSAAKAILKLLKNKNPKRQLHAPRFVMDIWDYLSFTKINYKDSSHKNLNYYKGFHKIPDYYNTIVENIFSDRSVYSCDVKNRANEK